MPNCLECTNIPAIIIKGVALCHTHAEQLIRSSWAAMPPGHRSEQKEPQVGRS